MPIGMMKGLTLTLLGTFQIQVNGEALSGFASNKVRALLTYLVVEAERPHRRDVLAEMLWPNKPERVARRSLKQALSNLRKVIGDRESTIPFLVVDRNVIQFNSGSGRRIDVIEFAKHIKNSKTHSHERIECCKTCAEQLTLAVELYHGDFLERCSLSDSVEFEEWVVVNREALQRQMSEALRNLSRYAEHNGDHGAACEYSYQLVAAEPWNEEGHRELMRILALCGQRSAALMQYKTCQRMLAVELGIEPAKATTGLFKQIRDGEYK